MSQNAMPVVASVNDYGQMKPLKIGDSGSVIVSTGGLNSKLAISNTTGLLIKASSGQIGKLLVTEPPDTAVTFHDSATVAGAGASNLILTIPSTLIPAGTVFNIDFPVEHGIVISTIGTVNVATMSLSYN
jgi:hypothetical protein